MPATTPRALQIAIAPRTLLFIGGAIAVLWLANALLAVILVVVVALMLAGTLAPAVSWLEAHKIRRGFAITLVFAALLVAITLLVVFTVPALVAQVADVVRHEPELRENAARFAAGHSFTAPLAEWLRHPQYHELLARHGSTALHASRRAVEVAAYAITAAFLALYFLIDRDRLRGTLFSLLPRDYHLRLSRVLLSLQIIVGGYIRGQMITSALMAVFTFALLSVFGIRNALALAIFAGLANVLPYVGVVLATLPVVIAAAPHGLVVVGVVLGAMLAYQELESRFIVPHVYGKALRLPSSIVLVALLVGGTLMGVVGALLALPVAAALRMLVEELRVVLPGEDIDDSAIRERDERAEDEYAEKSEGVDAREASKIAVEIAEQRIEEEGGADEGTSVPITGGRPDPAE